jgi:hypothetical protein
VRPRRHPQHDPAVAVVLLKSSDAGQLSQRHLLLYMLGIPALVQAAVAAASIVGERQQGTLEPVLTTPISREELVVVEARPSSRRWPSHTPSTPASSPASSSWQRPGVAPALIRGPDILAQLIFTPLIAAWSIWIAITISARSSDIRAAQQLSILASLPSVIVTTLVAFDVIHATLGLALGLGATLLLANGLGWRVSRRRSTASGS